MIRKTDFLIIGSGIAGLSYALKVAKFGKVIIITKKKSSNLIQLWPRVVWQVYSVRLIPLICI